MKYITITYKSKDPRINKSVWNGYAETVEQAQVDLASDPLNGGIYQILGITVQGFDLGDRVVAADHQIIDDEPGEVVGFTDDGWVIVQWERFSYTEEFHWTELKKVIE